MFFSINAVIVNEVLVQSTNLYKDYEEQTLMSFKVEELPSYHSVQSLGQQIPLES